MIGLYAALITVAIHARDVLAPPPRPPQDQWSAAAPDLTRIELRSAENLGLRGWLVRSPMPGAPWVVFFYGSNEDAGIERNRLVWLAANGVNAVCVDYRGYGFSDGRPSAAGIRDDAVRVFDYVRSTLAPPGSRIFVYGWSVGTQFAIHVAANRAVAGIALQAPPASAEAMAAASRHADVPWLVRWAVHLKADDEVRTIYQGEAEARAVSAPMLVIAGDRDTTVPLVQAQRVLAASSSTWKRLVRVAGADHNRLPFRSPPASTALFSFLAAGAGAPSATAR